MATLAFTFPPVPVAQPLVLLAPFPFDARIWAGVAAALDGRAITVDPPGFGASPLLPEATLEAYAAAVVAGLDAAGVDRFSVAGNSMGGYAALAVAAAVPERLAGIGLVGTKASADNDEARANRLAMADRAEGGAPASELVAPMLERLLGAHTRAESPELEERVAEWLVSAPTDGIAWAQRAMATRPDRLDVLRGLSVPAVVVHGVADPMMSESDAWAMAEALGVDITLVDSGHLVPFEAPDAVAAALRALV